MKRVRFSNQVKTYTPVMNNNAFYLLRFEPLVSEDDITVRSSPFQSKRKRLKKYMHSRRKEKVDEKKNSVTKNVCVYNNC